MKKSKDIIIKDINEFIETYNKITAKVVVFAKELKQFGDEDYPVSFEFTEAGIKCSSIKAYYEDYPDRQECTVFWEDLNKDPKEYHKEVKEKQKIEEEKRRKENEELERLRQEQWKKQNEINEKLLYKRLKAKFEK